MKLAYAAYKPLKGQFSDIAPGKFMEPDIRSAQEELDDYGFESSIYNDGDNDTVCHVIGHKQIYANINYDTFDNTNGGANNATFGVYKNVSGSGLERGFSWDDSSGLRSDDYNNSVFTSSGRYSEAFWKALNSNGANNTDCMCTLVVVDIRGTSTNRDWVTDIGTQINPDWGSFDAGMEIVLKSLYHGTGDTENCTKCNGGGCEHCKGYIPYNNISNPIFLVTGHSLGAAVANLVAEHLNSCKDTNHCPGSRTEKDIYAYTFATPKQCI